MSNQESKPAERPRLFVAIDLPEAWKQALAKLQSEMKLALEADEQTRGVRVRWVRPEGMHLTLKFLGETPRNRLESIESALERAVPRSPGFELTVGRVGSFSDKRAPRVVWAGIHESDGGATQLQKLAESVETCLAAAGFPKERRPFQPHLTLGRLPENISPAAGQAAARMTSAFVTPELPPFTVERVSLMRSHLGPGGARYDRLSEHPG